MVSVSPCKIPLKSVIAAFNICGNSVGNAPVTAPFPKFIAAFRMSSCELESHFCMEAFAVICEMFLCVYEPFHIYKRWRGKIQGVSGK